MVLLNGVLCVVVLGVAVKGMPTDTTTPTANVTPTCEGERAIIECQQYHVIRIDHVLFGREVSHSELCPAPPGYSSEDRICELTTALERVKGQCEHERHCEVVASTVFFDSDPCPGVYKYLKVQHSCLPENTQETTETKL